MKFLKCLLVTLAPGICVQAIAQESRTDSFGFEKFYPTKAGSLSWNSSHWANGVARNISRAAATDDKDDPYDSTNWTDDQSGTKNGFDIDGQGVLRLLKDTPRFHINAQKESAASQQFFLNVEYTGYFLRDTLGGEDWGGMVVGARSGAHNHGDPDNDDCLANTYYARFTNDGKWSFEKEWKHPNSFPTTERGEGKEDALWGYDSSGDRNLLPVGKWIGMKYVIYNKDESTVRLELYIDSTSNATAPGKWEAVGVVEDGGGTWAGAHNSDSWTGLATIEGCSYTDSYAPILKGGGTVLMRSDLDSPYYKYVTIREIDPAGSFEGAPQDSAGFSDAIRKMERPSLTNVPVRHFDALGRAVSLDPKIR